MEKVIQKLNELKVELEGLQNKHHSEGEERANEISSLMRRIIDRIYPEKDAKNLKSSMIVGIYVATSDDSVRQSDYLIELNLKIKVIKTILEESELFGLEEFEPIKERTETNIKVGIKDYVSWSKKKTK